MTNFVIALCLAAVVPILLAWSGLWVLLGAHPWWDISTAMIGAGIGIVVAVLVLRLPVKWRVIIALAVLLDAIIAATYGKRQFAASFSEDAFAGRLWYFGWIGISAGLLLVVVELRAFAGQDEKPQAG